MAKIEKDYPITDLSEDWEGHSGGQVQEFLKKTIGGLSKIGEYVEDIKQSLASTSTDLEVDEDVQGYIKVSGEFQTGTTASLRTLIYDVVEGEYIHIKIVRPRITDADRLSGAFYAVGDFNGEGIETRLVSLEGFQKWLKDGNREVDYEVRVPSGANKLYVFGGTYGTKDKFSTWTVTKEVKGAVYELQKIYPILDAAIKEGLTDFPKMVNPKVDIKKDDLKVLHIGNSFSGNALLNLDDWVNAAEIDASNMSIYHALKQGGSFKDWVMSFAQGDNTRIYSFKKVLGNELRMKDGAKIPDSSSSYGGYMIRDILKDVKFDLIVIHQVSGYSGDSEGWEGDSDGGFLKQFIRILRTIQPQAAIGTMIPHASYEQSANGNTKERFERIMKSSKWLVKNYNIDFVVPVGTAIENVRESAIDTSPHKLSYDNHHLADGLGKYIASATYYETLIAQRYGKSIKDIDYLWAVSDKSGVDSSHLGDIIDVTAENVEAAKMAVVMAVTNMWSVNSPDGIEY